MIAKDIHSSSSAGFLELLDVPACSQASLGHYMLCTFSVVYNASWGSLGKKRYPRGEENMSYF